MWPSCTLLAVSLNHHNSCTPDICNFLHKSTVLNAKFYTQKLRKHQITKKPEYAGFLHLIWNILHTAQALSVWILVSFALHPSASLTHFPPLDTAAGLVGEGGQSKKSDWGIRPDAAAATVYTSVPSSRVSNSENTDSVSVSHLGQEILEWQVLE